MKTEIETFAIMSFGGGSNPPWQRNSLGNAGQQNAIPTLQSQMINANLVGFQNFNQNLAMAQHQNSAVGAVQNNLALIPQLSGNNMGANTMFSQTVQYPNTRPTMNQTAFGGGNNQQQTQQQAQFQQQIHHQQQQQQQQQLPGQVCNKIGTVTKITNQCGFIDDEIVFYKNACKGISPKTGDRVLFEASYCPNAMFKWSASQVQIVPSGNANNTNNSRNSSNSQHQQQPSQTRGQSSGYNAVPPPNAYAGGFDRSAAATPSSTRSNHSRALSPQSRRSPERNNRTQGSSSRLSRTRDENDAEERRRRREKERDRERDKREKSVERRDRSPIRRVSPKHRRTRPIPRYMVQVPKVSLNM